LWASAITVGVLCLSAIEANGSSGMPEADRIDEPPQSRSISSPNGRFELHLELTPAGNPMARKVLASLRRPSDESPVWQLELPHQLGPRHALVNDDGRVALFDEWINIMSTLSIMVIGKDGRELARYGFDDIAEILGVERRDLAARAHYGPWIGTIPALSTSGDTAHVTAAGRMLSIDLVDGRLGPNGP
jgi:hypothetical protein